MTTGELLQKLATLPEDTLDDLVHDTASSVASGVNNEGYKAQVEYLMSNGWTVDQVAERLPDEEKPAEGPECSICRQRHPSDDRHPCE